MGLNKDCHNGVCSRLVVQKDTSGERLLCMLVQNRKVGFLFRFPPHPPLVSSKSCIIFCSKLNTFITTGELFFVVVVCFFIISFYNKPLVI